MPSICSFTQSSSFQYILHDGCFFVHFRAFILSTGLLAFSVSETRFGAVKSRDRAEYGLFEFLEIIPLPKTSLRNPIVALVYNTILLNPLLWHVLQIGSRKILKHVSVSLPINNLNIAIFIFKEEWSNDGLAHNYSPNCTFNWVKFPKKYKFLTNLLRLKCASSLIINLLRKSFSSQRSCWKRRANSRLFFCYL